MNRAESAGPSGVGFYISMVGLAEIPFALVIMYLLDEYAPMTVFGGISFGQAIAAFMILGALGMFLYGRRLGWKRHESQSGNPVKRS